MPSTVKMTDQELAEHFPHVTPGPARLDALAAFRPIPGGVPTVAPSVEWQRKRYGDRYDVAADVVTLRPGQAVICADAGAGDVLDRLCADAGLDRSRWPRARDWSDDGQYYLTRRVDVAKLDALDAGVYEGVTILKAGDTVPAVGADWQWDDAAPDLEPEHDPDFDPDAPPPRPDDDDDEDPTNQLAVLSRGLKVNKHSVAADTFKNSVSAIYNSGLVPAFNDMAKQVEFIGDVPWNVAQYGRILDDAVLSAVRFHLIAIYQGNDFDPSGKNLNEALDSIAYGRRFNPVRDYLDALEWDGTPRLAKLFGGYMNCGVDDYTRGVSIAFMVGAVARIRHPGCKFDTMPVLKGPQGWNKSSALRVLFGDEHFSDTNLGPLTNKDASMKLRGKWCHEFSEIESLRKHEVAHLKAFISSQVDRQRDPYARRPSDVARCTVFAGTTNEGGYLADATGGRRFWPLDVQASIDLAALAADRGQLWAEAAALEADGMARTLPEALWPVAAERQEAETLADPWEDILRAFLDQRAAAAVAEPVVVDFDGDDPPPAPPANRVHTSELFDALGIEAKDLTNQTTGRLRRIMEARLGWQHKKAVRVAGENRAGYARKKVRR